MRLLLIALALLSLAGCSEREWREAIEIVNASAEELPLSSEEVGAALRDSLSRGIARGARQASANNGYFGDPRLRIEFPPEIREVERTLRSLGLGDEVDRFVRQLNRSAEQAAASAKPIFIEAITSMTIGDAFGILNGERDAATQYLKRTTGDALYAAFRPIVADRLDETSATRYYGDIVRKYNQIPFVAKVDPDLVGYATERAIDGLFVLIAEEEANIRANPGARTTRLLRRVFGSLD